MPRKTRSSTVTNQIVEQRPGSSPHLYIAILTHNALAYSQQCLQGILQHTQVPFEIFVLDNGSTDGTTEWLSTLPADRVRAFPSLTNMGVPGGRNFLLRTIVPTVVEDGFVVFLDNDIEVFPNWYQPLLEVFAQNPQVAVAGLTGHEIIVHEHFRELLPAPTDLPAPVDVVSGHCLWVRLEAIPCIGLFDENLSPFWHEDDDFCIQAIYAGFEVYAVPQAPLVHHQHRSGAALNPAAQQQSEANQRYLVEKWRNLGLVSPAGRILRP